METEFSRSASDDESNMQIFDDEDNQEPANPLDEAVEVPAPNEDAGEAKIIKPKRVIKNPQPKLDAIRLMGPRGIGILQSTFKDTKFKGKGHEKEDLRLLMKKLEHWAHRLFPKFPFDDTLKQIEKLGSKKPVQNMVKRIRLDMLQSDELTNGGDNREDNTVSNDDPIPEVDVFDELLSTGPFAQQNSESLSRPAEVSNFSLPSSQPLTPRNLTDEQRERMERSRMEAQERRKNRLQEQQKQKEMSLSQSTENSLNFPNDNTTMESSMRDITAIEPSSESREEDKENTEGGTDKASLLVEDNLIEKDSTTETAAEKANISEVGLPSDVAMVTEEDLLGLIN